MRPIESPREDESALLVIAHRVHDAAERRMHDAPNRFICRTTRWRRLIVMGERQAHAVADDALHLVLAADEIGSLEYRFIEELGEVERQRRKVDVAATPQNVHAYCTRRTRLACRGENKIQRSAIENDTFLPLRPH